MNKTHIESFQLPYTLEKHDFLNLVVKSESLKKNPLRDSDVRHNYTLVPKSGKKSYPVIFHLSGYFSNGYTQFASKTLNENFVQKIDGLVAAKKVPEAVHIFVDATTYWGGSQFINSFGCGNYSDYISKDLFSAAMEFLPITTQEAKTCVMGGSSGGYGALALVSEKFSPFGVAFATAPDSFFEASLKPELFNAAPELLKYKTFSHLKDKIKTGELQDKKSFFTLVNAVAMAHCYSPKKAFKKDFLEFPIDLHTGELNSSIWKEWLKHDPIHFLKVRKKYLRGKVIHLDVGKYDNFSLQFGARQIVKILKDAKLKHSYTEFSGNHFGLSERRLGFLEKLSRLWKTSV